MLYAVMAPKHQYDNFTMCKLNEKDNFVHFNYKMF